jgi:hypothetical protein
MVERLRAFLGGTDEDFELLAGLRLADVFIEQFRAQGTLDRLFLRRAGGGADDALGRCGGEVVGLDPCRGLSVKGSGASAQDWLFRQ